MLIRGREREYLRYMYYGRIYNVGGITDEDIDVYAASYARPGGLGLELYRAFYQDGADNREFARRSSPFPSSPSVAPRAAVSWRARPCGRSPTM